MRILSLSLITIVVLCSGVRAQQSSYAGQQRQHPIKSLSPKEIDDYLSGTGLGFAKAAELNSYPGPKHVLELADSLGLTEEQVLETKKTMQGMKDEAVRLGEAIVQEERELDRLFASKTIDHSRLKMQTEKIAQLQGALRAVHLVAHLSMKELLTSQQIEKYDKLRGYAERQPASNQDQMHKH